MTVSFRAHEYIETINPNRIAVIAFFILLLFLGYFQFSSVALDTPLINYVFFFERFGDLA
jgi:hypothetical protein